MASWFSQPPQPPDFSEETKEHYQLVEDVIASVVEINRKTEMSECPDLFEIHQGQITEEEVIEALRHISAYKAQGSR